MGGVIPAFSTSIVNMCFTLCISTSTTMAFRVKSKSPNSDLAGELEGESLGLAPQRTPVMLLVEMRGLTRMGELLPGMASVACRLDAPRFRVRIRCVA